MTIEQKAYIMTARFRGISAKEIAANAGVSTQSIYQFLGKLRQKMQIDTKGEFLPRPDLEEEDVYKLFSRFFQQQIPLEVIAESMGLSMEKVQHVFQFCIQGKRKAREQSLYPALSSWLTTNGYTLGRFSTEIGVSHHTMSAVMRGRQNLRYELAKLICAKTGISMTELYYNMLSEDEKKEVVYITEVPQDE